MEAATVVPLTFYRPEGVRMVDLEEGDMVALDPFFGIERVVNLDSGESTAGGNRVVCVHVQLAYVLPNHQPPVEQTRFVHRALHEPVTRWRPIE